MACLFAVSAAPSVQAASGAVIPGLSAQQLQVLEEYINYLQANADRAALKAQIAELAARQMIKIEAGLETEMLESAGTYEEVMDLRNKIITGTEPFVFLGKPVDPGVTRLSTWTWNPDDFYTGMSTYTWGGLFPGGMPRKFIYFLAPGEILTRQQAIGGFFSYLLVNADTTTVAEGIAELAAQSDVKIDPVALKTEMDSLVLIYDEMADLRSKIITGTEIFNFLGKPVDPNVIGLSTWTWNSGDFYTGMSTYTWGGLFPEGMPQLFLEPLAPDMIINSGLSSGDIRKYLRTTKTNEYKAVISAKPDNPEANFGLALIEMDEFLEKNRDNFNSMVNALDNGNLTEVYGIYKSTGFAGTLGVIKSRLDIVKKADFFWFTIVTRSVADGTPFVIKAGDNVSPAPIPAPLIKLLAGSADSIQETGDEADKLLNDFVNSGPYRFDLNPNTLDFSKAKDGQGYINALRASNPDFLAIKSFGGDAMMKSYGSRLASNLERRIKALKGFESFLKSIGSQMTFTGVDEQIAFAETCLRDLRDPAAYTVIDGRMVNLSAWFDAPPANLLSAIENGLNRTDVTMAGLFLGITNPPVALSLTAQSRTTLKAQWGANGNPPGTQYEISVSSDAGFDVAYTTTTNTVKLFYLATGLIPDTIYYSRVRAKNAGSLEYSDYCPTAIVQTPPLPVVYAVSPGSGNSMIVSATFTVTGAGFLGSDSVRLEQSGMRREMTVSAVGASAIDGRVSLLGLTTGQWNVVVYGSDGVTSGGSGNNLFTMSLGSSGGGITINDISSTGAVANSGNLTVTIAGVPELDGGFIYLSTDPLSTPLSTETISGVVSPGAALMQNMTIEVVAYNNSQQVTAFSSGTVKITIHYPDSNPSDGIVDGTDIQEESIKMVWLNTVTHQWTEIHSQVDPVANTVWAYVNHFSVYGLIAPSFMSDLSTVKVYPNPWKPGSGGSHDMATIMFGNLAADTTIRIYNLVGELVKELKNTTVSVPWDGKTASGAKVSSGVYFAYIKSGSSHKIVKFAIER